MMFPKLVGCAEDLRHVLKVNSVIQDPVDIKDVVGRFTTDIIGSCGFGIDCNSLKNPDSEFRRYGKMIFDPPFRFSGLRNILFLVFPRLMKLLKIKQFHREVESFFITMVENTIEYREKKNVYGKDFLDLLLQLKHKGEVTDDEDITKEIANQNSKTGQTLSMNEIAAQCFVFFGAGFETSATTLTFALLELAIDQDVQNKLRKDVFAVLEKHNKQLTYESVTEMAYLDAVFNGKFMVTYFSPSYKINQFSNFLVSSYLNYCICSICSLF